MRALCLVLTLSLVSGCASWWQAFTSDPMAYVQSFESGVETFLTTADGIVSAILPSLGDKGPALDAAYENAKLAVGHAESALNDLVQAAIDAKNDSPNFAPAIADVLSACDAVEQAVQSIETAVSNVSSASLTLTAAATDLKSERATLERYRR